MACVFVTPSPPGAKPAAPGQVPAPLGFRDAEGRKFPGGAGLAVARDGHLRYPPPGSDTLQGGIRGGRGQGLAITHVYAKSTLEAYHPKFFSIRTDGKKIHLVSPRCI